eukprot:863350-Heterocapsa_arctica.AAC.1
MAKSTAKPFHVPRYMANELCMASILAPLMRTNLRAQVDDSLWALDASLEGGGACWTTAGANLAE